MTNILIVDDSSADRQLAGHLLEKLEWSVFYAENGKKALEQMHERPVDLVLTDLVMPELDGLGFVQRAKDEHPLVPVVLMTARGSEEVAVRALEIGAASYVPKKALARDLVEVVERILAASQEHQSYARLLGRLRTASFVLENDPALISSLVSYLTQMLRDSGMFDDADCNRIATALDEALTNACYHGNLEVRSEVRAHDARAYRLLAQRRRELEPYKDRRIHVSISLTSADARFVIKDDGRGFEVERVPDPTALENLENPSGRGVFLMRTFMDEVDYNDTGNEVTLLKRRTSAPASNPSVPDPA